MTYPFRSSFIIHRSSFRVRVSSADYADFRNLRNRRNLRIRLLSLLLIALPVAASLTSNLDYTDKELKFGQAHGYDLVSLDDATLVAEPGAPALPVFAVNMVIPQGMRVTSATAQALTNEEIEGEFRILPAQPPQPISSSAAPAFVPPDPTIYGSNTPYPPDFVRVTGQGAMSGYNIASLLITPLQYLPVQGKLTMIRKLSFTVNLESDNNRPTPIGIRDEKTRNDIEEHIRSLVINPDDVSDCAPTNE